MSISLLKLPKQASVEQSLKMGGACVMHAIEDRKRLGHEHVRWNKELPLWSVRENFISKHVPCWKRINTLRVADVNE